MTLRQESLVSELPLERGSVEAEPQRARLSDSLATAEASWAEVQQDPRASLGEKALAAVRLQTARAQLSAYDDFHPLQ